MGSIHCLCRDAKSEVKLMVIAACPNADHLPHTTTEVTAAKPPV